MHPDPPSPPSDVEPTDRLVDAMLDFLHGGPIPDLPVADPHAPVRPAEPVALSGPAR